MHTVKNRDAATYQEPYCLYYILFVQNLTTKQIGI